MYITKETQKRGKPFFYDHDLLIEESVKALEKHYVKIRRRRNHEIPSALQEKY